jgi:hypothetical protein
VIPTISSPRLRLALLGASVMALFALGPPEVRMGFAYLCPFLVLIAFLLADRYPGERLIASTPERAPRRRPQATRLPAVSFAALRPRGGRLLASSLAGRAPPVPPLQLNLLQISI